MKISVKQRKQSRKKNTRFQKLWELAERLRNENDRLNRDLDNLLDRVRRDVVPAQIELSKTGRDLIMHLLPFLRRKSLTGWQRAEIRYWIEEQLELLAPLGLMDDVLEEALARDSALQMGLTIDEESELSPREQVEAAIEDDESASAELYDSRLQCLINEEVEKRVRREFSRTKPQAPGADLFEAELQEAERTRAEEIDRFRQQAKEDVREQFEKQFEDLFGDAFDTLFGEESGESGRNGSRAPALDHGLINRMFRRTANVLHPDKEHDEVRRDKKQSLMGALLEARQKGDILTIFNLHQEHVGGEPDFDAGDKAQLLVALEQQIQNLRNEKDKIINQSTAHASAYRQFYARSRKGVDRIIAEYISQSEQHSASMREVIGDVKTLKTLKPLLEQRYRERCCGFVDAVVFDDSF